EGFYWLQSLDHDTLTFLLVDPFIHLPEFSIHLPDEEMGILGTDVDHIVVLGIVTLPANPDASLTVNLQGPLVINAKRGVGRQLVVEGPSHSVRHPLDITAALLAS
ncbi:MAG: flagellar assembly protein FliW, partial [Gemmatimonadetes bacterium]|nr:flagellar assembly protein FliW [Gemmatimonadota bacterium]